MFSKQLGRRARSFRQECRNEARSVLILSFAAATCSDGARDVNGNVQKNKQEGQETATDPGSTRGSFLVSCPSCLSCLLLATLPLSTALPSGDDLEPKRTSATRTDFAPLRLCVKKELVVASPRCVSLSLWPSFPTGAPGPSTSQLVEPPRIARARRRWRR